jgi:hypothetical protein
MYVLWLPADMEEDQQTLPWVLPSTSNHVAADSSKNGWKTAKAGCLIL